MVKAGKRYEVLEGHLNKIVTPAYAGNSAGATAAHNFIFLMAFLLVGLTAPTSSEAQGQPASYTVFPTPSRPISGEAVELTLSNSSHNCCATYDSQSVLIEGTDMYLFYSVSNVTNDCLCPSPGFSYYDPGALDPGVYNVYVVEAGTHCPPGEICIAIILAPEKVGALTVLKCEGTQDSYLIDRAYVNCLVPPCQSFIIHDQTSQDSTCVAGVKDLDGQYVCELCELYIEWIDGDVPVRGYFERDSLEGWMYSEVVFRVTEILNGTAAFSAPKTNRALRQPITVKFNPARRKVRIRPDLIAPKNGLLSVYNPKGEAILQTACAGSDEFVLDLSEKPAGIYTIQLATDNRTYYRRVLLE
ncbi:T9SS type A sorting domain-containing protein [Fibrobacterota bacterium]